MKSRSILGISALGPFVKTCGLITLCTLTLALTNPSTGMEVDLVSREAASRAGLTTHWFTHVRVNPAHGGIAFITQHINDRDVTTVYELTGGLRKEVFSENDLDAFGEKIGITGAEERANTRLEVLTAEGWEAKIEKIVKPKITFYVVTESSIVQAIDGETGATRWTARVGTPDHAPQKVAATDDLVVAVNGSTVYFLDAETGFVSWTRETKSATGVGAVVSNRYAFVPLMIGGMIAFPTWNESAPMIQMSTVGRNFIEPTASGRSLAWANDRGQLNVAMTSRVTGVAYRLSTDSEILSPSVYLGNENLVTVTADGYVLCIKESNGNAVWRASTGERLRKSPFVVGDSVFAISILDSLIKISHPLGEVQWQTPGISGVLASNGSYLFCKGTDRELLVVDVETGGIVNRIYTADFDLDYVNMQTDRIILGQKTGMLQCLRMVDLEQPMFHVPTDLSGEGGTDEEMDIPEENEEGEKNPFRVGGR